MVTRRVEGGRPGVVSGQGNQKTVRGKQDESRREMKQVGDRIILLNREKVRG